MARKRMEPQEDISDIATTPQTFTVKPVTIEGIYADVAKAAEAVTVIQERKAIVLAAGDALIVSDRGNLREGVAATVRKATEDEVAAMVRVTSIPAGRILLHVAI